VPKSEKHYHENGGSWMLPPIFLILTAHEFFQNDPYTQWPAFLSLQDTTSPDAQKVHGSHPPSPGAPRRTVPQARPQRVKARGVTFSPAQPRAGEQLISHVRYVEGLNDARTKHRERRVSARRGWVGETGGRVQRPANRIPRFFCHTPEPAVRHGGAQPEPGQSPPDPVPSSRDHRRYPGAPHV
jgi:hypothetical protein